jgi:hypothetical protein
VREKRPRKRDTADVAGCASTGSNRSGCAGLEDEDEVEKIVVSVEDTTEGAVDVEVVVLGGGTGGGFALSILDRGDAEDACTGEMDLSRLVSALTSATVLRPQNDNRPPPIFLPLIASAA